MFISDSLHAQNVLLLTFKFNFMRSIFIVLLLSASTSFAQQEILLQTHPEDRYILSYTTNSHTLLFDYEDVLSYFYNREVKAAVKTYIDQELLHVQVVELNQHVNISVSDSEMNLTTLIERFAIRNLLLSGNLIVLDKSGRALISSLSYHKEETHKTNQFRLVFRELETGSEIYRSEKRYIRFTGCPTF